MSHAHGEQVVSPTLRFAVVREDPLLESRLIALTGTRAALLVASGGCTALTLLARDPDLHVTAFDLNPVQLGHVRAKADALGRESLDDFNVGSDSRAGLNQCGAFEGLFRLLRNYLEEFVAPREELASFFAERSTHEMRLERLDRWRRSPYWSAAFELFFHDALLNAMFGRDATQHAEPGSYPSYFRRVFERGLSHPQAHRNPFLHHILLGAYKEDQAPDYLTHPFSIAGRLDLVQGTLLEVQGLERFGVISLSNVFDWSDDSVVGEWAEHLSRSVRVGTAIILRQLNNRRPVRHLFGPGWRFDGALGQELLNADRSLFYENIEVAFRSP